MGMTMAAALAVAGVATGGEGAAVVGALAQPLRDLLVPQSPADLRRRWMNSPPSRCTHAALSRPASPPTVRIAIAPSPPDVSQSHAPTNREVVTPAVAILLPVELRVGTSLVPPGTASTTYPSR